MVRNSVKVQSLLEELRSDGLGVSEECAIWEVVGGQTPGGRPSVLRFGDWIDHARYRILRNIALIEILWVPFLLSFVQLEYVQALATHPLSILFDSALSCIYGMAVLIELRTSVVDLRSGSEYVDPLQILICRSLAITFWMDIVSLFGAFWWISGASLYMAAFRLMRVWRLSSTVDSLYELHTARLRGDQPVVALGELMLLIFVMIHLFACAWFGAMTIELEGWENKIASEPKFLGGGLFSVYLVYFADGAAMLVGWTGPAASAPDGVYRHSELVVWTISSPCAALSNAFVFARLMDVLAQATNSTSKHLNRMAEISAIFDSLQLPAELKRRCLRYHIFLKVHNASMDEYQDLFHRLPKDLQQEVKLQLFDTLVNTAPFFQGVPANIVIDMVSSFQQVVYGPGQYIMRKGDMGSELFFMIKGSAEVLIDGITVVATKKVGDYFGEVALVFDQPRNASIRSKTFSIVAKLDRAAFQRALEKSPAAKEFVIMRISGQAAPSASGPPVIEEAVPLLSDEEQRDFYFKALS